MEYVGRRVKKEFPGHGTFLGLVVAFDQSTGFLRIAYDDGDSEELEISEIAPLLVSSETLSLPANQPQESCAQKSGRPKKRRRTVGKGKGGDKFVSYGGVYGNLVGRDGDSRELGLNLNEDIDLNDNGSTCLPGNDTDGNEFGDEAKLNGLDVNQGLNARLNSDERAVERISGGKKKLIDLNLDANDDFENLCSGKTGITFDLNLQLVEDDACNMDGCMTQLGEQGNICVEGVVLTVQHLVGGDHMEVLVNGSGDIGNTDLDKIEKEEILSKSCENGFDCENTAPLSALRKIRDRKRRDSLDIKIETSTSETIKVDSGNGTSELEMRNGKKTSLKSSSNSVDYDNGNSNSVPRGRNCRKRKELSDCNNSILPTPDTRLRRSTRRANMASYSVQERSFNVTGLDGINDRSSSPAVSIVYDEKIMVPNPQKSWDQIVPQKVELPPSSCNLDLDEASVFDFLSVYAFLRSFSTLLFLSPFKIDDFVASIKCNESTILFDSIHVSLLKAIRKHLEFLVSEGSVSASNCLRSLNWDYLDSITWPMFTIEYLLLHSPGYIPGLDLGHLKYYQNDYYKLPISAKVEILQHLCDDVIEVDAFRSELNRRTSAAEGKMELDRNMKFDTSKRRKCMMDVGNTSCTTEEEIDEHTDWNSDECFLCKMDGNLICCDGCPAAFHSRCVGVASNLLPEGDWYCPECMIDKDKPWVKVGKSIRGAKLLGIDPYGRLYYSSYGYLLVLESCGDHCSIWLYNSNSLRPLIEVLDSVPFLHNAIITSICEQWCIIHEIGGTRNDMDTWSYSVQSDIPEIRQPTDTYLTPSKHIIEVPAEKKSSDKSTVSNDSKNVDLNNAEHINVVMNAHNHGVNLEHGLASFEESAEVSQSFIKGDMLKEDGINYSQTCADISDLSEIPLKLVSIKSVPAAVNSEVIRSQVHSVTKYVNCYDFARTASYVFEDVICKLSKKTSDGASRAIEDIIAAQMKVLLNRSTDFSWANMHNSYAYSRKEKCGWCFNCKVSEDGNCLFITNGCFPAVETFMSDVLGIQSGYDRKKHLIDIMCHIICMEDHLHGLLLGPWLNPHYSTLWRECILEVANIGAMKKILLKLEANLHRLALSADWRKAVDSVPTMGSAAHIVSSSVRVSSKQGIGRKGAKGLGLQSIPSSNAVTGLTLLWWRGGRVSRNLFNWKVLPQSLASKAARQGGFKKITGIFYPDSGEYAKRTKCDAWRAAVEASRSVEQLALQVRELDASIRWHEIGMTNLLSKMDNESKKSVRSFRKAIIRRKSSDGTTLKYLIDFGRRRFIPDVVVKHGSIVEDSTHKRKKYWLEEPHIPLYLLKAFEEKRIARRSNKMSLEKIRENIRIIRKPMKKKGFLYLFSKAERLEISQCGHCNKDVPVGEALRCQHCIGFFHKRHILKSVGIMDPSYTCHKCRGGKIVKTDVRKLSRDKNVSNRLTPLQSGKGKRLGKKMIPLKAKNTKRAPLVITLRRSARNAERMSMLSLRNAKVKKKKKKKHSKLRKGKLVKPKINCCRKKRTPVYSSYWLNGLLLTRKSNDERLEKFKSKKLLVVPEKATSYNDNLKCCLCNELEYTSNMTYVACEICGVWFHGDALDLSTEKITNLIGFKCYKCLNRKSPVCPHNCHNVNNKAELMPDNAEIGCAGIYSNGLLPPDDKSTDKEYHSNDESGYISFTVDAEQKSPGLTPESYQKFEGLESNEKIFMANGSVEFGEGKEDVFNSIETDSAIFYSGQVDKKPELSSSEKLFVKSG